MSSLLDGLIGWSIRHRVVVLIAAVLLAVLGVEQTRRAQTDVLPDFTPPFVVVQTEAPGLTTTDVEEVVTRPLERVLLGVPGVENVRSQSAQGVSVITLLFQQGLDIYRARQLVTERVGLAASRLPASVKAPVLAPVSAPISALFKLCVTAEGDDPAAATRAVRRFADWTIRPRLLAIPGVSQVIALGGGVDRVEVRPSPARMRALGVTMAELRAAVADAQSFEGIGFVELANARIDVQSGARLAESDAVDRLRELSVKSTASAPVRLRDVADVELGEEPRTGAASYDGKPAVYLQINKLAGADTEATSRAVEAALGELAREAPKGARIEEPAFRQAAFVERSVSSVAHAMAIGGALVIAVLLAFLRSPRLAVISLVAIPLAMLGAATFLVRQGVSINAMTLGGLALAVGEVVDDAIVDVENVWRRLRENAASASPRAALDVVRDASHEIRGSVTYATAVVILVLLPVLLLGGLEGAIFAPLATAYALSIAFSLVIALTVTPAMCAWLLPRLASAPESAPTLLARALVAGYSRLLRLALRVPALVLLLAAALGVGAVVGMTTLGGSFLPELHERSLIAKIDLVPGVSLEETMRVAARAEAALRASPYGAGLHVAARAGRAEGDEDASPPSRVELDVVFPAPPLDAEATSEGVSRAIESVPGLTVGVEGVFADRIHDILSGESAPIVVRVEGEELGRLRGAASEAAALLRATPGLEGVRIEPQVDIAALRVTPEAGAAARFGLRPREIVADSAAALGGEPVAQILGRAGRTINVSLVSPPSQRTLEWLRDAPVTTDRGALVSLGDVASIAPVPTPARIQHEAGIRRIAVQADVHGAGMSVAAAQVRERLSRWTPPPGTRWSLSGEAEARSAAAQRLLLYGAAVLVAVFLVLAIAFSSLRDAAVVLVNIPLGLVGGVAAAALSPGGLSVSGFVGFITLFGIIARNGIMLVAHVHHVIAAHPQLDRVEQVVQAARERLIPIAMTAATAGLGLLPLAFASPRGGNELEVPMARIVVGGLSSATLLNMIVLPTILVLLARRDAARGR